MNRVLTLSSVLLVLAIQSTLGCAPRISRPFMAGDLGSPRTPGVLHVQAAQTELGLLWESRPAPLTTDRAEWEEWVAIQVEEFANAYAGFGPGPDLAFMPLACRAWHTTRGTQRTEHPVPASYKEACRTGHGRVREYRKLLVPLQRAPLPPGAEALQSLPTPRVPSGLSPWSESLGRMEADALTKIQEIEAVAWQILAANGPDQFIQYDGDESFSFLDRHACFAYVPFSLRRSGAVDDGLVVRTDESSEFDGSGNGAEISVGRDLCVKSRGPRGEERIARLSANGIEIHHAMPYSTGVPPESQSFFSVLVVMRTVPAAMHSAGGCDSAGGSFLSEAECDRLKSLK